MRSWSESEIRRRVEELAPWFHNMELGGTRTAPDHFLGDYPSVKWQRFAPVLEGRIAGRSVLDIGCNAGFHSIQFRKMGARKVIGIDTDPAYLAQARFAAEVNGGGNRFS